MYKQNLEIIIPKINNMECLLGIHAVLLNRTDVPRIYLSYPMFFGQKELENCLLTSITNIKKQTWNILHENGISPYMFVGLTQIQISIYIDLLYTQLIKNFQTGLIHYEMARFTPFTHESCTNYLGKFTEPINEDILESLSKRIKSSIKYVDKFPQVNQYSLSLFGFDIYSQILYLKINSEWQKCWQSENHYKPEINSIISGVLIK